MNIISHYELYSKNAKIITAKIKKHKKMLYELKYFTDFHMEACEKNNNILLYLRNKYPGKNIYVGYIDQNSDKIFLYNNINIVLREIIKSNIYIKN